ncbi:unnamed protein product [Haemonchus placei]|uniref:Ovule protein n=1 Tax=Haemonchus placei TaxID=6290 RepID=A0A0N4W872_HAEPC|nr:unnamed protein product [Haemonchus placei]
MLLRCKKPKAEGPTNNERTMESSSLVVSAALVSSSTHLSSISSILTKSCPFARHPMPTANASEGHLYRQLLFSTLYI